MSSATESTGPDKVIVDAFVNTGRTGRRNAMGDILEDGETCANTSELPTQLDGMNLRSSKNTQQGQNCTADNAGKS